nr:hypothetical protein Itr_chr09CG13970 [Ipomoea trifida]
MFMVNSVLAFLSSFPPISSVYRNQEEENSRTTQKDSYPSRRTTTGALVPPADFRCGWSFSLDHSIRRRLRVRRNFFAEVNLLRCCFRSQVVTGALFTIRRRTCRVKKKAVDAAQPLAGDRRSCCVYWRYNFRITALKLRILGFLANHRDTARVADCRRSQIPTTGVHFFVVVGSYRRGSTPPVDVSGDKLKFATQP